MQAILGFGPKLMVYAGSAWGRDARSFWERVFTLVAFFFEPAFPD